MTPLTAPLANPICTTQSVRINKAFIVGWSSIFVMTTAGFLLMTASLGSLSPDFYGETANAIGSFFLR